MFCKKTSSFKKSLNNITSSCLSILNKMLAFGLFQSQNNLYANCICVWLRETWGPNKMPSKDKTVPYTGELVACKFSHV